MAMTIEDHPNLYARTAGAIYLVVIVFGGFSEGLVAGRLIVPGDALATGHNIVASHALWGISLAGNLVVPLIAVAQLWIEYLIYRPVSRNLALLFVLFNIVSLSIESVSKVFQLAVLPILEGDGLGGVFTPPQLYALAHLSLLMHDFAFDITLIFFGCACLICGTLIFKSTYLPKFVGVLMQVAGTCYLIASFAALFAPLLADAISPWILLPPFLGESSLCLWLLFKGVDFVKWKAKLADQSQMI